MNLTVRIHDVEYTKEVAQGVTFSEEYNETLDSGAIRLTHIKQIANLRPYDDVYIYESAPENYEGDWYMDNVVRWRSGGELHDGDNGIPFYRHLLVDNYTESLINISEGIMSYNIDLMSETKRLEMIQLPNICVTQPLKISKRHSIWWLMNKYVNSYSPKIKQCAINGEWRYMRKYKIDPNLEKTFGSSYSQDFSLQNPTLKDVLSSLMITKDMIPYVKDDVIYAKDIGHTTGIFNMQAEKDSGRISTIAAQMTSADYCDGVRRQYSNALSSEGTCTFVEHLGFRNKDSALMSLDNMRLELGHPIYRIKKCRMCYYTNGIIADTDDNTFQSSKILVKHDITPLIKQKEEWSLLNQDWRYFSNGAWGENYPTSMEELAKYQLSTVHYAQGGTTIEGWGDKYSITKTSPLKLSSWDIEVTRLENILNWLSVYDSSGDISSDTYADYLFDTGIGNIDEHHTVTVVPSSYKYMFDAQYEDPSIKNRLSTAQKMKTIFFEIEYEGFYDGALIHSRDKGQDNIIQNDNSSVSLLLLEKDGTSQKAKVNRFANKTYSIKARLDGDNYNVNKLLQLGSSCNIGADNNVIVYHREYSIYDNYILASYACIQDYVLKNFYTSVYAKYRINQLMSYGESVNRSENEKVILSLSKTKKYLNEKDTFFSDDLIADYFSAFKQTDTTKNINMAMVLPNNVDYNSGSQKAYLVDCYTFTSGNSLCVNIAMPDNISGGTYIDSWSSDYKRLVANPSEDEDYVVGSEQKWNSIVDDEETGEIGVLNLKTGHLSVNDLLISSDNDKVANVYKYLQKLPSLERYQNVKEILQITPYMDSHYQNKDNKERIDATLQIESISDNQDIIISPNIPILSDLVLANKYKKTETSQTISKIITAGGYEVPFFIDGGRIINYNNFYFASSGTGLTDFFESKSEENKEYPFIMSFSVGISMVSSTRSDTEFSFVSESIYWTNEDEITHWYIKGEGTFGKEKIIKLGFRYADEGGSLSTPNPIDGYYLTEIFNNEGEHASIIYWSINIGDAQTGLALFAPYGLKTISQSDYFSKNMYIQYNSEEIEPTIVEEILPCTDEKGKFTLPTGFQDNVLVSDIFKVANIEEANNEPTLLVNVTYIKGSIERGEIKSINYWYLDFDSAYKKGYAGNDYLYEYTPEESGYKFVFGVNVSKEDIKRAVTIDGKTYIPIYISKLTNRDTRVYDDCGMQVKVMREVIADKTPETGLKGTYVGISTSTEPVDGQILMPYANTVLDGITTNSCMTLSGYAKIYHSITGEMLVNKEITNQKIGFDESVTLLSFGKQEEKWYTANLTILPNDQVIQFTTDNKYWRVEFVITSIDDYVQAPIIESFTVVQADDIENEEGTVSFYVNATIKNPNAIDYYNSATVRSGIGSSLVWESDKLEAGKSVQIVNKVITLGDNDEQVFTLSTFFKDMTTGKQVTGAAESTIEIKTALQAPIIESITVLDNLVSSFGNLFLPTKFRNPNDVAAKMEATATMEINGEVKDLTPTSDSKTIYAGKRKTITFGLGGLTSTDKIGLTTVSATLSSGGYFDSKTTTLYTYGTNGVLIEPNVVDICDLEIVPVDTRYQFNVTLLNTNSFRVFVKDGITVSQGDNSWTLNDETLIEATSPHTFVVDTKDGPAYEEDKEVSITAKIYVKLVDPIQGDISRYLETVSKTF